MGTEIETDTVVVGAGVAGLNAAYLLQESQRVQVLEARDQIGGRLASAEVNGAPIDLGATWIWPDEPLVSAITSKHKLETFLQYDAGDAMFQTNETVERIPGQQFSSSSFRLNKGTRSIAQALFENLNPDSVQLEQAVHTITEHDTHISVQTDTTTWLAKHVIVAVPPATAIELIEFNGDMGEQLPQLMALSLIHI